MNRTIARAAAITLAGLAVLGPAAAASADPSVSIEVDGQSYGTDGSGSLGQTLHVTGSACTNPDTGDPGYMGQFVMPGGDPWVDGGYHVYETTTDGTGAFDWETVIPLDNGTGTFGARWYCSTTPVEAIEDGSIQWVGPLMTMTITDGAQGFHATTIRMSRTTAPADTAQTQSLRKVAVRGSQIAAASLSGLASGPANGVTVTTDPDSLPAVDRINIPGDVSAELKARVDSRSQQGTKFRSDKASKGGSATYTHRDNVTYVAYAFRALTGRNVSAAVSDPFVQRLDEGEIRASVIEDIALTAHSAGWWTTLG
jgi:hypothetical protein